MSGRELTVDEIVAMLRRSSIPTILVEGPDDIIVYRWFKKHVKPLYATAQQCYGRNNLLEIYARKDEFPHIKTVFLADKDMYLFIGVPKEFAEIVWTTGYSIENDIYAGSSRLDDLLDDEERENYTQLMNDIIEWFAFEVEEHKSGRESKVDIKRLYSQAVNDDETYIKINYNSDKTCFKGSLILRKNFKQVAPRLIAEIKDDYRLKVRGKIIFELLTLYFNAPKRPVKHKSQALYEIGAKPVDKNPHLAKMMYEINKRLGNIQI